MNIGDERDLRAQLGVALDEVASRPLPLGSVIRQGRAVKIRRRVTAAIGVAVIAAAAVATPAVLHSLAGPAGPSTSTHYRVTVTPPGPGSPRRLIAYVGLDGQRWQAVGYRQGGLMCLGLPQGADCRGPGLPPKASRVGAPASIVGASGTTVMPTGPVIVFFSVRADVTQVRVSLSNGQVLTLRPVAVFGPRYASCVAWVVPSPAAVTEISAYSAHGEIAYAVPLTAIGSFQTVRWLSPDEPALPKPARRKLGSGRGNDNPWTEYAYIGPWGVCTGELGNEAGGPAICDPATPGQFLGAKAAKAQSFIGHGDGTVTVAIVVSPAVSYLVVRTANGGSFLVHVVSVGGARFCAFTYKESGVTLTGWTAYSASGAALASGAIQ
jgi:hypothetical protein